MGGLFGNKTPYSDPRRPADRAGSHAGASAAAAQFEQMHLRDQNARRAHPHGTTSHATGAAPVGGVSGGGSRVLVGTARNFPSLLRLTNEELRTLLTDQTAFATFLHDTEEAKDARAFTRDLRNEIAGMCAVNIEMADEARDLKAQLKIIGSCDQAPVLAEHEEARKRAEEVMRKYDLDTVLDALRRRAAKLDEECEAMDEKLQSGKMTADEFCKEYPALRQRYHEDALKAAIVQPALESRRGGGPPPPPPPPPPHYPR